VTNYPINVFVAPGSVPPTVTAEASAPPAEETITSQGAAIMLGITMNNLRQLVFKKKLTPVGKDGRRNLFSRAEVMELAKVYIAKQVRSQ
jgi:hypothetical protein